jgi:hypothetical protein
MRDFSAIASRPWPRLVEAYRELLTRPEWQHVAGLVRLLEYIEESELANVLHGAISHEDLLLSPYDRFDFTGEVLRMHADPADGAIEFHYAGAGGGPHWTKRTEAKAGPEALDRFVRELKWVEQGTA